MVETDTTSSDGSLSFGTHTDTSLDSADMDHTDLAEAGPDMGPEVEDVMPDIAPPFICTPVCDDRVCGPDGCGDICGECGEFEICSNKGLCNPDPQAGCAGLSLAENWAGTFDGTYIVSAVPGLGPLAIPATEGDTSGDINFTLKCFNSKLIISGQATGQASGQNPFQLDMAGDFYPDTGEFDGKIPSGNVTLQPLGGVIDFEGEIPGTLQTDGSLSGTYHVDAVKAVFPILGEVDVTVSPASSSGTWVAFPAP